MDEVTASANKEGTCNYVFNNSFQTNKWVFTMGLINT